MYEQYLKENEIPILADTKIETQETVILTDKRVIYIKGNEQVYAEKYKNVSKLRFYDNNFSVVTDPNDAFCIEFVKQSTSKYNRGEFRACFFSGFPNILAIALQLHLRCTGRAYDEFLSSKAIKINKSKNKKLVALIILYFLMCILGAAFFAPLVPFGLVFFFGGLIYLFKEVGKVNKTEWQHRNEIYNIHPNYNETN